MNSRFFILAMLFNVAWFWSEPSSAVGMSATAEFNQKIRPVLEEYCYDCHGDGENRGGVALDAFNTTTNFTDSRDVWWRVLKNLRANLMPPAKKSQPTREQKQLIQHWIKTAVFEVDPRNPDPGRVTIRRLNRVEYQNTVRDLVGVDFDALGVFPPDDTGHGFDNIGDVLTLSPMLLEKYLDAAEKIISVAVTTSSMAGQNGVPPKNYARFFPQKVPESAAGRREYARELLGNFARHSFRRPVDNDTTDRLASLAESVYDQPGKTFEAGVTEAMVAVLASPRFIFREENIEPASGRQPYALVDEYALASRLSYFLWSSMPDDELFQLAAAGKLRKNLSAQLTRMLADKRADALEKNFIGQWLQARDIETVPIEARSVLAREQKFDPQQEARRKRFRELNEKPDDTLTPAEKDELADIRAAFSKLRQQSPRADLTPELRRAMRQETESVFNYIVREDRSLLELLDSDYTFVNERLARHYGITNVVGPEMRRVTLPPDSPRGGILTEGTVLAVTSNPTRTSPVKRGVFILDNILGTPALPPPPNVPPLEDAAKGLTNRAPTLRETLAVHRENPLCASCHNQMDPIGLALENFNALGMWRDQEFTQPIDPSGQLVTGEEFSNIKELKRVLVKNHAEDFYRTLTQKLLTYALGRGLEYYDVETVDQIVARIEKSGGKPSALLAGIVESAPFQKTRGLTKATAATGENTKEKL
jgi:hypothetical protein